MWQNPGAFSENSFLNIYHLNRSRKLTNLTDLSNGQVPAHAVQSSPSKSIPQTLLPAHPLEHPTRCSEFKLPTPVSLASDAHPPTCQVGPKSGRMCTSLGAALNNGLVKRWRLPQALPERNTLTLVFYPALKSPAWLNFSSPQRKLAWKHTLYSCLSYHVSLHFSGVFWDNLTNKQLRFKFLSQDLLLEELKIIKSGFNRKETTWQILTCTNFFFPNGESNKDRAFIFKKLLLPM